MKRKIKVHGKVNLYETSAVGLPAYPDAHASIDSFSLVKSLTNASLRTGFVEEGEKIEEAGIPQLNLEDKEAMVENEESTPEAIPETPVETEEPKEPEKEPEKDAPEEKPETSEIAKAIADGIKAGFKQLETERGLVDKQTPVKKSLGELTMGMHNSAYNLEN